MALSDQEGFWEEHAVPPEHSEPWIQLPSASYATRAIRRAKRSFTRWVDGFDPIDAIASAAYRLQALKNLLSLIK